jgi:hypothetical protein
MLDGKINSVIGRFRGGRSGPLSIVSTAHSVSNYINLNSWPYIKPKNDYILYIEVGAYYSNITFTLVGSIYIPLLSSTINLRYFILLF